MNSYNSQIQGGKLYAHISPNLKIQWIRPNIHRQWRNEMKCSTVNNFHPQIDKMTSRSVNLMLHIRNYDLYSFIEFWFASSFYQFR